MQFFEDIEIGEVTELGSHLFTKQEIVEFAKKFDPQRFHVDEELARDSLFGNLCASGWHTTAIGMRKLVETFGMLAKQMREQGKPIAKIGPAYGFEKLRWLAPVFPDDTITYSIEILDKKVNEKKPQWGILTVSTKASKSSGELALSYVSQVLVERKEAVF